MPDHQCHHKQCNFESHPTCDSSPEVALPSAAACQVSEAQVTMVSGGSMHDAWQVTLHIPHSRQHELCTANTLEEFPLFTSHSLNNRQLGSKAHPAHNSNNAMAAVDSF